jgi:heme O synthase-like polyprenyltransferase
MMSVTHPDLCRRVALRYSAACIGICSAAPILGLTTWAFAVDSLILNLYFTFLAYRLDTIFLLFHKACFDFLLKGERKFKKNCFMNRVLIWLVWA